MQSLVDPVEVCRTSLLERLERVRPKILALIAPAGFGKTTVVRQFIAGAGGGATCDCAGVQDELDLARRLIPALAAANPEREQGLTQRELMLGDGGTTVAERVAIALEAWREQARGVFVFENAEHLAASVSAREFLGRLLAGSPEGRTVVICSRENLRMHFTRYAPPHEIMVLRAQDLVFDADDVREIFAPFGTDQRTVERVAAVSQGWPIAVLLLRRFATEGRIDTLLDRLDDVAFEELHDYLADEVLNGLDAGMMRAIFACACVPRAQPSDLRALKGTHIADDIAEFVKESPFITRDADGAFIVHPLLASLLCEHQDERRIELLRRIAGVHEENERYQRAAELYLAAGDQHAAARALGRHEVLRDHSPSMHYARVLSSLDHQLVQRYPRLWGVTALLRVFCVDTEELLDEAESIWRTLAPDVAPIERYYVFVFRMLFMSYLGMFAEAFAMIEEFNAKFGVGEPPRSILDGYMLYLRGVLEARVGKFSAAERDLSAALPFVEDLDVAASGTYLTLGTDIARVRGERAVERQFIERALARAESSGLSNFVAFTHAEAVIGAWFAGDQLAMAESSAKLDEYVERFGVRGFGFLAAVGRGRHAEPSDADLPKYVAFARLIALTQTADERERITLAHSALSVAQQRHGPFVLTLAALAAGILDPGSEESSFELARAAAANCEAPSFGAAVDAAIAGRPDTGVLRPFLSYFARQAPPEVAPLAVDVVRGTVAVDGKPVALSGRELELVVALALRRESTARSRLATMLWPDMEEFAARNALSVCLHRLRQHLGRNDLIVREGDGYALHPAAHVDLWEIDRVVGVARLRDTMNDAARASLFEIWTRLREGRPSRMQRWEWFAPTERRLAELRVEIAHRLASEALERGDTKAALEFAGDIIAYDACDEPARELTIRAYLLDGDRAAAMRQFRQYRETLLAELQCEPSATIAALVMQ